jgi:class 3 adenylate cyclase
MSQDGRVVHRMFKDVATFVTDIRGFTELTENVTKQWGVSVFDVLSGCYFPQISELLERYGCHYLNYTGDGLLVLTTARKHPKECVLLPSLDNAVLCAMELTLLTNSIAEAWRRMGLVQASGDWHETGIGLASGDVAVGDPFVPDRTLNGKCAEFDQLLRSLLAERMPHFQPRTDFTWRVRSIHALSPAINRASRLQDANKLTARHSCIMTEADVNRLCPPLREWFEPVGTAKLKGIGEVQVFGFNRFVLMNVPELEKKCFEHFICQESVE